MTIAIPPVPLHWPGLPDDIPTVVTDTLRLTRLALRHCTQLAQPALLYGRPGTGKPFAVTAALNELDVTWLRYAADHTPHGSALLLSLLELLEVPVPRRPADRTQEQLLKLLARRLS